VTLALKSAAETSIEELATLFTRAFEGYVGGTIQFTRDSFLGFVCHDNIDLTLSRLLMNGEQPIGLALLARQGWTSRVAAMGIIPEAQSQGKGGWFLAELIGEAKARSDRRMVLESITQNTRAVQLYQRADFSILRRLFGYSVQPETPTTGAELTEVDIYEVAKLISQDGLPDLPWQVSGTTIARFGPPNRAYRLEHAYAVVSDVARESISLRALIVPEAQRRQGQATRLLQSLFFQFPGKRWVIPPICPEELGRDFLDKRGFVVTTLSQVQMTLQFESL
jgi:ribosomal protein S18 acetylase RimI-like enzyme